MTEKELRLQIELSEKNGFRLMFDEYKKYVYKIIWDRLRFVGTAEDAEECLSDVFAEVFFRFGDIKDGSLKAFIGTVAKHKSIDRYRHLYATRTESVDEDRLLEITDHENISETVENNELNRRLYEKIESLGEPDSSIIIHKYYYGRKSSEIAQFLGMNPTAVRVRLNRAIKRLKNIIKSEDF